jgi:hypothetical protein
LKMGWGGGLTNCIPLVPSLFWYFCVCGTRVWTQGFILARQVLYLRGHAPSLSFFF